MPSGHIVGRSDYQSYLVDKTTMTCVRTSVTEVQKKEFISSPGRKGTGNVKGCNSPARKKKPFLAEVSALNSK